MKDQGLVGKTGAQVNIINVMTETWAHRSRARVRVMCSDPARLGKMHEISRIRARYDAWAPARLACACAHIKTRKDDDAPSRHPPPAYTYSPLPLYTPLSKFQNFSKYLLGCSL